MIHRITRVVVVATIVALATLGAIAPASAGAGDRPFHGWIAGGGAVAPDTGCPIGLRTLGSGTGRATHLGLVDMASAHCTPNPPFGPAPGPILGGQMTFTAANGDEIWATYSGTVEPLDFVEGATIRGHTPFVITGGTGRFTGATGHADMAFWGTLHLESPMVITWTWYGSISY